MPAEESGFAHAEIFPWRVHFASPELLGCSQGSLASLRNANLQSCAEIELPDIELPAVTPFPNMTRTLLRRGIHHILPLNDSHAVIFFNRLRTTWNFRENRLDDAAPVNGSRPLYPMVADNWLAYGDYRTGSPGPQIGISTTKDNGKTWRRARTIPNIRHIHGIFGDQYSDHLWISTGDSDTESAILQTDSTFSNLRPVIEGSQIARTVFIAPCKDFLIFGTDSPFIKNKLCRLDRDTEETTVEAEAPCSVFYGCQVRDWIFLSCTPEPSRVNRTNKASLLARTPTGNWWHLLDIQRARYSNRHTIHGQIHFPLGPGDDRFLWISPLALRTSAQTLRWEVPEAEDQIPDIWPDAKELESSA